MSLLATVFVSVLLLPVVTSLQTPDYLQHFNILAQSIQLAQSEAGSSGISEESLHLLNSLLTVDQSVLHDAVLKSVKKLSESDGINDKLVELLQDEKLPSADAGTNYTISPLCLNHTADLVVALTSRRTWALQMLDAMGKPSPAIRDLNIVWPGAFDYCRSLRSSNTTPPFSGQYCNAAFDLSKLSGGGSAALPFPAVLGLCIPDSCSGLDYTILLYEVVGLLTGGVNVSLPLLVSCPHPKQEGSLDTRAVVGIVICSLILFMMVLGTALDVLFVQWPKWSFSNKLYTQDAGHTFNDNEVQPLLGKPDSMVANGEPGTCMKVFLAFSVYTNASKLLSTNQPPGSLSCVHGIRFLSMTWVVLGHVISFPISLSGNFLPYFTKALKRWTFQAILNATVSVDTFFVLSGLLVAYLSLKEMRKRQGKMSWFLFYFHRFWRLTPAYMLLLMFYVCIFPYMGSGPVWPDKVSDLDNCEANWWTNLLYVNNLVNLKKPCFGHAWYLANDMQFYVLSPLIFVPFYFSPVFGAVSAGVFLLATAIAPGVITMQEHFGPNFIARPEGYNDTNQEDYMGDFYVKPYNRMGPYVVGMLAGYFLYRTDCKLRISAITNLSIWGIATAAALAVLYGLYDATNGHPVTLPVSAFYNAVNRQVWGACVSWVVIACVTGNGGFVNTILSWKALIPLSRLTYCIYLLHIMVIALYLYSMNTVFYYTDLNVVFLFLGVLVISCMAAFVASLAFEAPMMGLEKIVFRRDRQTEMKSQDPGIVNRPRHIGDQD